jgi:hypothetical protein
VSLVDLLWYLPIAVATALAVGAAGRDGVREGVRGSVRAFWTLLLVVGGVGIAIRALVLLLV